MKESIILCLICLLSFTIHGQEVLKEERINIEDLIEDIAENSELEIDYTLLYEDLYFLEENPVNINHASREDLQKLHFLTEMQILNLLMYIRENGPVMSVYELQLIEGFSEEIIRLMMPFILIGEVEAEKEPFIESVRQGKHQIIFRTDRVLEEQKGFSAITDSALQASPNSRYLGRPLKSVIRYRYHYKNKIYWGLTAEKDPGEEFFKGSNKHGFDFYSGHIVIRNNGVLKTLALGDYHLRFGQGLTLWSGISYGKTPYVLNLMKKDFGISRYSSTEENRFLRGVATTIKWNDLEISGFFSRKRIDANIQYTDTLNNEIENVTSFQVTGYHATPSQVEDEDAISETILGGNLVYKRDHLQIGATLVNYRFEEELIPDERPYNKFDFQGKQNTNVGAYYRAGWSKVNLFGEVSHSFDGGTAFLNGLLLKMHSLVSFSALHRYYQKNYYPFYSQAISENSTNKNEQGLYMGIQLQPVKYIKVSGYFDAFKFPWLKYNVDAPSRGMDYRVRLDYSQSKDFEVYISLKEETKPRNQTTESTSLNEVVDTKLSRLRLHLAYWVSENLQLRTRIELSRYRMENCPDEDGYLVFQDILYRPVHIPLSLSFRYSMFDTDTWDSRIYAYEHDLLYSFSIPAFHTKGIRTYFLVKYSPFDSLDLWLRLAQTYYSQAETIGTGLNEIDGKTKTEVKVQVRIKF